MHNKMGHPLTYEEQEILEDAIVYYKDNKKIFLRDISIFLIISTLLFCLLLLQN